MPQLCEIIDSSSSLSLLVDKGRFESTEPENIITLGPTYLQTRSSQLQSLLKKITKQRRQMRANSLIIPQKHLLKLLITHNQPTSVSYK